MVIPLTIQNSDESIYNDFKAKIHIYFAYVKA